MIFAHDLVLPSEGEGAMKPSGIWNMPALHAVSHVQIRVIDG
jgi:hypothetical protein